MKQYRVLDLFAGGGGFSAGFVESRIPGARFEIVKALDNDPDACKTLESHLGRHKVLQGDITEDGIKKRLVAECRGVDVIIGGPPCQTFSMVGPSRSGSAEMREALKNDGRNTLYRHYFDLVSAIRPKFMVFENVEGIVSKEMDFDGMSTGQKRAIEMICDEIEALGYSTQVETGRMNRYQVMDAADFGVPQHRKRVIIIANRIGLPNPVPEKRYGVPGSPYRTLAHAIQELPVVLPVLNGFKLSLKNMDTIISELDRSLLSFVENINALSRIYAGRTEVESVQFRDLHAFVNESYRTITGRKYKRKQLLAEFIVTYNEFARRYHEEGVGFNPETSHRSRVHNFRDVVMFSNMKPGSNSTWFMNTRTPEYDSFLDRLYPYDKAKHQDTYVKHAWDKPCRTILSHMQKDGLRFIHPDQPRTFTPLEAALIQSFPCDYAFSGGRNAQYRQIGNAVPPLMAKSIGNALLETLVRSESPEVGSRQASLA